MFNKILVALDGSEHAAKALDTAIQITQRCDSELLLFHAVDVSVLRSDYDQRVVKSARQVYEQLGMEQAEEILNEAEQSAREAGVAKVSRVVGHGDPVKAMLKELKERPADLVVVGTRGLTGLREIAMGSVAHKMSVASPCPVLIVK